MALSEAKKKALFSVLNNERQLKHVQQGIIEAIRRSFIEEERRAGKYEVKPQATRDEVKRRTTICYNWFLAMRAECGYSVQRAIDMLPTALRSELDGDNWVPPKLEKSWGKRVSTDG